MRLVRAYGIVHKMTHAFKLLRAQQILRRIVVSMSVTDFDLKDGSLWGMMADFVKNNGRGGNTFGMPPSHRVLRAFMILVGYNDEVANTITSSKNGLDMKNVEFIMYTPGFFEALQVYWVPGEVNRSRMMAAFHAMDGLSWKIEIANPICNSAHGALAIKCLAYIKMAAESMGCDTRKVYMSHGELASLPRAANTFFGVELQHAATVAPFPFIRTRDLGKDPDTQSGGTIKVVVRWGQEFGDENEIDANLIAIGADGQCLDVAYHFKPELYCGSARVLIDEEAAELAESGEMCRAAVAFDVEAAAHSDDNGDDDDQDTALDASKQEGGNKSHATASTSAATAADSTVVQEGGDNGEALAHHPQLASDGSSTVLGGVGAGDDQDSNVGARRTTAEMSATEKSRPDRFMTYPPVRSQTTADMITPENTPTTLPFSSHVPHVPTEVDGKLAKKTEHTTADKAALESTSSKEDAGNPTAEEGGGQDGDEEKPAERRVSQGRDYHMTLLRSSVGAESCTSNLEEESVEGRSALRQLARAAASKKPALPAHKRWPMNSATPFVRHDRYDRTQLDEFPGSRNACEHHIHTWDHDYIACDIRNGEWAARPTSGTIANRLSRYTRISEMHHLNVQLSQVGADVVLTPSATEESGSDTGGGESGYGAAANHHFRNNESDTDSDGDDSDSGGISDGSVEPVRQETVESVLLKHNFRDGVSELRAKVAASSSSGGNGTVASFDDSGCKNTEETIDFPTGEAPSSPQHEEALPFPGADTDDRDAGGGGAAAAKGRKHTHGPTKRDKNQKKRQTARRLTSIAHASKQRSSHLSVLSEHGAEEGDTDDSLGEYDGDMLSTKWQGNAAKALPGEDGDDGADEDGFGKPSKPTIVWHAEGFHIDLESQSKVGQFKSDDIVAYAIVVNAPVENESLMRVGRARVEIFREDHHGNHPTELLFDMPMDMTLANSSECVATLIHRVPAPEAERSNTEQVGFERGREIKFRGNAWAATAVGNFVDRSSRRSFDPQYFTLAMETCNSHLTALKIIPPPELRDPTAGVRKGAVSLAPGMVDKTLGIKDAVTRSSLMSWLEDKGTEGSAKIKRMSGIGSNIGGIGINALVGGNATHDNEEEDEMMQNGFFNPFEMDVGDSLPLIWEYSDCNLRVGVGWDAKGGRAVDMDLIVLAYAGEDYFDQVDFGKLDLNGGGLTHLGDNRSGEGDGDDESVVINLDLLDESITQLFLFVTIHGSDTFAAIDEISIRFCITTESDNHDIEKEKEVCRFSSAEIKHLPDSHRSALIGRIVLQEMPGNESQWHFHAVQGSTQGTGNNVFELMTESHLVAPCEKAKSLWRDRVAKRHKEKVRSKVQGAFLKARRASAASTMFLSEFGATQGEFTKPRRTSEATADFLNSWTSEKEKLERGEEDDLDVKEEEDPEEEVAQADETGNGVRGAARSDGDANSIVREAIPQQQAMDQSWDQYSSIDASKDFREKRRAAGLSSPEV